MLYKRSVPILIEGHLQLLIRVHHDRAVPGHRFADGLAGYEQEPNRFPLGRDGHLIAVAEKDPHSVVQVAIAFHIEIVHALDTVGIGIPFIAENPLTGNDVGEDRMAWRSPVYELGKGRERNIEILGLDDNVSHRTLYTLKGSADDLNHGTALGHDLRHLRALYVAVPGSHHLMGFGEVGPELKSLHDAFAVSLGHLLMDDAAAGGHPLHVARSYDALVSKAVAVGHVAFQNIGDRLDAAVRVPGKAFEVSRGIGVAEIIEQQKRIEERDLAVSEDSPEMNPRSFESGLAFENLPDLSVFRHGRSSISFPAGDESFPHPLFSSRLPLALEKLNKVNTVF